MRSSLALQALALISCGNGINNLSLGAPPLVTLRGSVDPALVAAAGAPVRAALVWGAVPNYVTACVVYPGNAQLQAACPDPFSFVPGVVNGDVAVGADGSFEIPIMQLPPASLNVGSPDQSIAWGSVIVAADADGSGALNLLSTTDRTLAAQLGDPALAASFFSLHAPQVRVGFREGTFDSQSTFYPLSGCAAPPAGFSVLATPGFSPPALDPAPGECSSALLEPTPVQTYALTPAQAKTLACASLNRARVRQPGATAPGRGQTPTDPVGNLVCLDAKVAVYITEGDCPTITTYALAACDNNLLCKKPDWDLTKSPPTWWTCGP
jgi:hypothetical protein